MQHAEDGVDKLIRGNYTPREQAPDADLGRSLREGFRNPPAAADPHARAFGVPSVRTDLPAPQHLSVANRHNYGNEADCTSLLSPCSTADRGVNEVHYLEHRSRAAIRELLAASNIALPEADFEVCFAAASEAERLGGGAGSCSGDAVSLKAFMEKRHEMLRARAGL